MPARDDCILWRLRGAAGEPIICFAIDGDEGLALTVEYREEILLAEMMPNLGAAMERAEVVRKTLVEEGWAEPFLPL